MESLRRQPPLPETTDELCQVARSLGTQESALADAVYLGRNASVTQIKSLSEGGVLKKARVVHFATHGLLADKSAMFFQKKAEPSLLLTPPTEAVSCEEDNAVGFPASCMDDNGLLSASEVAQLKLDADWVILSACNTAAGGDNGAEALSGLARAFFYAGARSLLVSHWYVNSSAAVAITTGAVKAIQANPRIGRAEALRQSLSAVIAKGGGYAHPSIWGPFVLVGNGGGYDAQ